MTKVGTLEHAARTVLAVVCASLVLLGAAAPDTATDGRRPASLRWIGFRAVRGEGRVLVRMSGRFRYTVREPEPRLVIVELENTSVPASHDRRPIDARYFDTPVERIVARRDAGKVRIEIRLKTPAGYAVREEDRGLVVSFAWPHASAPPSTAQEPAERAPAIATVPEVPVERAGEVPAPSATAGEPPRAPPDVGPEGEWATARVEVKAIYAENSTETRRLELRLPFDLRPLRDTRLRLQPVLTRFWRRTESVDRLTLGAEVRQGFPLGLYAELAYRPHLYRDALPAHELAAEVGGRRAFALPLTFSLSVSQRPLGDDASVGALDAGATGGVTLGGIQERLELREARLSASGAPWTAFYLYADGRWGALNDGNDRRTVAAGCGLDLLMQLGLFPGHSFSLTYDFYGLFYAKESPRYFSPRDFYGHAPGVAWRSRLFAAVDVGAQGAVAIENNGAVAVVGSALLAAKFADRFSFEARARHSQSRWYQATTATVSLGADF